ncbi:MAG: hypothetical protein QOK10_1841 [Pseudonocardiales bacterium]|jgi:hypothetical protein|nr:hypothetical protein [Pseudonocardiales bacterium]
MNDFSFTAFEQRVGQPFLMRIAEDIQIELSLLECTNSQRAGGPPGFTLHFAGGPDAPPSQGTYLLSADGFDEAPIFLVPLRRTAEGLEYHAVFSQSDEG